MSEKWHRLDYLAGGYFHQDYDQEAATPLDAVRLFKRREAPEAVAELISDIRSLLDSAMTEQEIYNLWVGRYEASYDPLYDGTSYRDWFASVLDVLTTP